MPPVPNVRRIVGTLMVPTLTTVIMLAMFAVAVPFIRNDLGLAPDVASWLLVAYSLPHMMLMPLYGRLADGIGKRRLLLTGATLFAAGTAVLVVAGSFPVLLLGRAIQGAGASAVNPIAIAVIMEFVRPEKRGNALGTWNASGPIAGVVGPLIAGGLIDAFGWRSILLPALAVGLASIVLVWALLPESRRTGSLRGAVRSFDWVGVALFNGAIAMLVFFTSSRPITGADPLTDLRLLAGALVLGTVFVWWSLRRDDPFIDLSIFRRRNFSVASVTVSLRMVMRGGTGFLMPLFVTDLYGFNASATGSLLMLDAGSLLVTMWLGGLVIDRRRSRGQVIVGMLIEALAMTSFLLLPAGAPVVWVFVILGANGLGAGYMLAALHVYAMGGVPEEESATAAGLYSMIRFGGAMLGPAIGGVVLAAGVDEYGIVAAGYRPAFAFLLTVSIVGTVAALLLTRRLPREAGE